jgi:hypothetical protein
MARLDDLPNESLAMIASVHQGQDPHTLTKLARVSKKMRDIARVPLYKHVTIVRGDG